jgi:hypothetical protein
VDSARVVCNHSPDAAIVAACRVYRQPLASFSQLVVKNSLDDPRLRDNVVFADLQYAIHVLGKIQYYSAA